MALWTDIVNPAELSAFSRVAFDSLDDSLLTRILPNVFQDDVKFSWTVGQALGNDVAEYGEFDTEASIGGGKGGEEKTIRLLPVSRKRRLSEYAQVTEPSRVQQLAEERADEVVRAIINRLNRARAQALVTGSLTLSENGIKQTVAFGRKSAHTNAAPTALWSAAGADPIADLRKWADMITDETGQTPDVLAASSGIATSLGGKLASAGYITGTGAVVSRDAVNEVLANHELPALTVFDGRVAGQRLIADTHLVMAVSREVGGTVFAPTVEASDPRFGLADADRSGVVAGLYREDDPPVGWVLGKAVALPILANPNASLSAKVL